MSSLDRLSPHFAMWELTVTDHEELQGTPTREHIHNARMLLYCVVEPLRRAAGVPFRVESFYRGPRLNAFVGGDDDSLHMDAAALDFTPRGVHRRIVWERFLCLVDNNLPFTEAIIYEETGHIHVAYAWWDKNALLRNVLVRTDSEYVSWANYQGPLRGGIH